MIHYPTSKHLGCHYAVGANTPNNTILVQLQDRHGEQVRVELTPGETQHLISLLEAQLRTSTGQL